MRADTGVVDLAGAADAARFGNKAAGLAALLNQGLAVPPGLAIDADFAKGVASWDAATRDAVRARLDALGYPVAVRSSSTDEDSGNASFAGQYLTILNIRSADAAFEAIGRVGRSAVDTEAYRARLGIDREPRVGVVVQRLIPADVAGVCFTKNPITRKDERMVSASWGLGEAVVASLVVPDTARMRRGGELLEYKVGQKSVRVQASPAGETETVPVDPDRVRARCLTRAQLERLEVAAARCEALHQRPVDFEWAFLGPDLFILQCRPVTT